MPRRTPVVARPVVAEVTVPAVACPSCGSRACAVTGYDFCRHTGLPRIPDPVSAARLAAIGRPGPLIPNPTPVEAA